MYRLFFFLLLSVSAQQCSPQSLAQVFQTNVKNLFLQPFYGWVYMDTTPSNMDVSVEDGKFPDGCDNLMSATTGLDVLAMALGGYVPSFLLSSNTSKALFLLEHHCARRVEKKHGRPPTISKQCLFANQYLMCAGYHFKSLLPWAIALLCIPFASLLFSCAACGAVIFGGPDEE